MLIFDMWHKFKLELFSWREECVAKERHALIGCCIQHGADTCSLAQIYANLGHWRPPSDFGDICGKRFLHFCHKLKCPGAIIHQRTTREEFKFSLYYNMTIVILYRHIIVVVLVHPESYYLKRFTCLCIVINFSVNNKAIYKHRVFGMPRYHRNVCV